MPVLKEPQTGRIYEMGADEAGRIRTALRLGWYEIDAPAPVIAPVEDDAQELPVAEPVKPKRKRN